MMPSPLTSTCTSSGTTISIPPMNANARMVTSCDCRFARRRSRLTPPMTATVVCSVVTVHGPLRSHPPRTANDVDGPGPPVTLRAGADSCCGSGLRSNGWRAGERSRVSSARSDWNTAA